MSTSESNDGDSRSLLKLNLGKKNNKKDRPKRVVLNLETRNPKRNKSDVTHVSSPSVSTVTDGLHSSKDSPLDSYLESIGEVQYGNQLIAESDDDIEVKSDRLNDSAAKKPGSKLDKIVIEASDLPFKKVLTQNFSSSINSGTYRIANGISIEGSDIAPITDWYHAGLTLNLISSIEKCGYGEPTPIQAQSLPVLLSGSDLLGIAPTGSGKTAAFSIPLCRHIAANRDSYALMENKDNNENGRWSVGGPYGLILVPTRELCMQIHHVLKKIALPTGISVLGCYGGVDIAVQIACILRGACNIIVATPGRLIDLLAANNGRVLSLRNCTFLVIDETDRMFDLGFGPQVRKIVSLLRPDRQTAVFSATMSSTMEKIVQRILTNPVKIFVGLKLSVPKHVQQNALLIGEDNKFDHLKNILSANLEESAHSVIIFTNTQNSADELSLLLVQEGFKSQALHGGMDQRDRETTMNLFKAGKLPILVATSIAARGLDVHHLKLVINYDPANHLEDYIHRAGRTGRAGNPGKCITFLNKNNIRQAYELAQLFEVDDRVQKLANEYKAEKKSNATSSSEMTGDLGSIDPFKHEMIGFVGHGLSKLDQRRELHKSIEFEVYSDDIQRPTPKETDGIVTKIGSKYVATLMINDISREARLAVTAVQKQNALAEKYEVSITLKGEFITKKKTGSSSSKKLHLQIEGVSSDNVINAYGDLMNVIKNHTHAVNRYSEF